jgi:hypothetical protein
MKTRNFPRAKEARKVAAEKRKAERDNRSVQDQLARLDQAGFVAKKEREKLSKVK